MRAPRQVHRLQAAVLRKRGKKLEAIAYAMGCVISTIHRWLFRMGHEDLDSRSRLLSTEQVIEGELYETPRNSGFERGSWNAKMISKRILELFGVQ